MSAASTGTTVPNHRRLAASLQTTVSKILFSRRPSCTFSRAPPGFSFPLGFLLVASCFLFLGTLCRSTAGSAGHLLELRHWRQLLEVWLLHSQRLQRHRPGCGQRGRLHGCQLQHGRSRPRHQRCRQHLLQLFCRNEWARCCRQRRLQASFGH